MDVCPHTLRMLSAYRELAAEREAQGIPALPLTAEQTQALTELLQNPPAGEEQSLLHLLSERIPPGVDEAAYVKATWLSAVAQGDATSPLVSPLEATQLLGTMVGGYNVAALIELLQHSDAALAAAAAVTEKLRLGTGICLVPQRQPVYTAKMVADVDYLSGGRVDFGIGVGWLEEEFEALGMDFSQRGPRTTEDIHGCRAEASGRAGDPRWRHRRCG